MRSVGALGIAAAVLVCAACASSSSSTGPKPPSWLEKDAKFMKRTLGDPRAKISYVLGPFPIAIVQGHLTCGGCSRPAGAPVQTGTAAAARYDAGTRGSTDFAIGDGSAQFAIHGVCEIHHDTTCASGGRAKRAVLYEGVSLGADRRVLRYSEAESRRRARATLLAWRQTIVTRAERWPRSRWHNPRTADTARAFARIARRQQFQVTRLVWHRPEQLAPEIIVRTAHYVWLAHAMRRLLEQLRGYEAYYVEADDERGVPFIYVSSVRRGPSAYGRWWARSDAVAPFEHL